MKPSTSASRRHSRLETATCKACHPSHGVTIRAMLDHLSIQCADMAASAAFYDAALKPLGGSRVMDFGEAIGFGVPPMPDFWIGAQTTGEGFRQAHIAFTAPDPAAGAPFLTAP